MKDDPVKDDPVNDDHEGPGARGDRDAPTDWSRWLEIDTLFDRLLDLPPEAREDTLAQVTDDPEVRQAVQRLLRATADEGPEDGGPSPDGAMERAPGDAQGGALGGALGGAPGDAVGDATAGSLPRLTPSAALGLAAEALAELDAGRLPERIGPFRPVRELGSGGMGTVYLAEREGGDFRQEVAVKVLRRGLDTDRLLARFRAERRILAGLRHPHVAALVDGGSLPDGRPWLAMEYVEGRPLVEACEADGLGERARVKLVLGVAQAVQEAHRNLVVHRDIKPSNVLVTAGGVPKLLDFGIAKLLGPAPEDSAVTELQGAALTPRYAAPEQRRREPVTTATDVYQLGLLLAETLTGTPPALPDGAPGGGPRISGLKGDLGRIVAMATHEDPLRRYRDAGALAEELERWLTGRPVVARPDSRAYRTGRFLHRNPWVAPVAAAALLLLGGWGWSLARGAEALRAERDRARAEAERATLERDRALAVTGFLNELFRAADPRGGERGDTLSARTLLERGAARLEDDETLDPAVAMTLAGTLAQTAYQLGMVPEAQGWMAREVAFAARVHGESSAGVGQVYLAQAVFLNDLRAFAEAARRAEAAVTVHRRLEEPVPEGLARSLHSLSLAHVELNRVEEARQAEEEAYRILQGLLPAGEAPAAPDSLGRLQLSVVGQLAYLDRRSGEVEAAEARYRELLALERAMPGLPPDTPATTLNNLGMLLVSQGRLDEAEPYLRENLALMRAHRDPADRNLEVAAQNLAGALWRMERLDQAEALLREEMERVGSVLPSPHWRVGNRQGGLATFLERTGRWDEALPLRDAQVETQEAALGADHSVTLEARLARARVLGEVGRRGEAAAEVAGVRAALPRVRDLPDVSGLAARVAEAEAALGPVGVARSGEGQGEAADRPAARDPRDALARAEAHLLRAEGERIEFQVVSEGAFSASLAGTLFLEGGGALALEARGVFGADSVTLALDARGERMTWGNASGSSEGARPAALREAVGVGFVRMGVLHNLARLVAGAPPDRMEGGVRAWVEAVDPVWAEGEPLVGVAGVSFGIRVAGQPSGSATVWLDADGVMVGRDQLVQFPTGEMRVRERYGWVGGR